MRVASLDIGTNTALLLIADVTDGKLDTVQEARSTVRLGEGLDSTGVISDTALERLGRALERFAALISDSGVDRIIVTGTSASRDARNAQDVKDMIQETFGVGYQIVSGKTEASLTFVAATFPNDGIVTIVDIGGGSTEIVYGSTRGKPRIISSNSFDIGSVRLTERMISEYPVTASAQQRINAFLSTLFAGINKGGKLIAIGGTATTVGLTINNMDPEQVSQDDEIVLSSQELEDFCNTLLGSSVGEIVNLSPVLMEGRADVIGAGVLILQSIVKQTASAEVAVRFRGVRHATALICGGTGYSGDISADVITWFE